MDTLTYQVAIIGGGPAGLTLAIELGRRGVSCVVLDDKPGTTIHPQANATQARTMEHFRRLGFANEIRRMGLPANYPTDVVYFSRFNAYELARMRMPSAEEAEKLTRRIGGSWSTPELPHRCSQLFIEPVLRSHAEKYATVSVCFGWRMSEFRELENGITLSAESIDGLARMEVRSSYLVGCDGARSAVRRALDIPLNGESQVVREFMGGKVHATYFRSRKLYDLINGSPAWMYFTFNEDRRSSMMALNGIDTFVFHAQLKEGENHDGVSDVFARKMFEQSLGTCCEIEKISASNWHAGYTLVADRYGTQRVFLAGDAAHLFTPTGGLGYNTAIDDVANLAWKLAAALKGWGGPGLLQSYQAERHPIGIRNTRMAKAFADHIGYLRPSPLIEEAGPEGDRARRDAGAYLLDHLEQEFNIPGITFGVRYEGSPLIVDDGMPAPQDNVNIYVPSAKPGGRAPHWWLPDETSLFDRFGPEFTLLVLSASTEARQFKEEADALGIPLEILHAPYPELRDLYESDIALIRPDQHVAWRGFQAESARAILKSAVGYQ